MVILYKILLVTTQHMAPEGANYSDVAERLFDKPFSKRKLMWLILIMFKA